MSPDYWYYYFSDKKCRNSFTEEIGKDTELSLAGVRVVNVANEVTLTNGSIGYLAVLSSQKTRVLRGKDCRVIAERYYLNYECYKESSEANSPYDY